MYIGFNDMMFKIKPHVIFYFIFVLFGGTYFHDNIIKVKGGFLSFFFFLPTLILYPLSDQF